MDRTRVIGGHTATDGSPVEPGGGARLLSASLLAALIVACGFATSFAQQIPGYSSSQMDRALAEKLAEPGDLTLRNTSLGEALFTIGETWKVNLVVGEDVEGQVNGVFKAAPLHEILDAILLSNGYSYRPVGQSLVIMKLDQLGDVNPLFEASTIRMRQVTPSGVLNGAKLLSSPKGKVEAIDAANSLLVLDFPDRVAMIRQYVEQLDGQLPDTVGPIAGAPPTAPDLQVMNFHLHHVKAIAIKEAIQPVLSKDGKVAIMELDNRVIVVDDEAHLRLIDRTIKELDIPRPQVRITALIYDLSLEDRLRLGINWDSAFKGRVDAAGEPGTVFEIDSITNVPPLPGTPNAAISLVNLSRNFDLDAVINALRECHRSRLLADPNVTVMDNEPALISIVTEIPYQELTQTSQGGQIGTTSFREAGVKLIVTPRIAADGTIQMYVEPSFSRLAGFTPGDNPQPIIDKREAKTAVRVANEQTLVIGGLRERHELNERDRIPFLSDLPLGIGYLFRHRDDQVKESELVVFLTPIIVTPLDSSRPHEPSIYDNSECWLGRIPVEHDCAPCQPQWGPTIAPELGEEVPAIEGEVPPIAEAPAEDVSWWRRWSPEPDPLEKMVETRRPTPGKSYREPNSASQRSPESTGLRRLPRTEFQPIYQPMPSSTVQIASKPASPGLRSLPPTENSSRRTQPSEAPPAPAARQAGSDQTWVQKVFRL